MPKLNKVRATALNQRGAVQFLVLLILVVGIIAGVYLVREGPKIFKPKATVGTNIFFVDSSGNAVTTTTTAIVNVKVISPEWPQPTIEPTPTSTVTPIPTDKPDPKPRPTGKPKPTRVPKPTKTPRVLGETASLVTTVSVVFAEDPTFTSNKQTVSFTTEPITYTFSNSTAGTKTLYSKFIASDGQEQNANPFPATITLTAPTPSPTPTVAPTSSPEPVSGFGKALSLKTTTTGVITIPSTASSNGLVLNLWIKPYPESLTGTNGLPILQKEFGDGINGYDLSILNKKIMFKIAQTTVGASSPSYVTLTSSTTLQMYRWYHISVAVIPNLDGAQFSVYLNINNVVEDLRGTGRLNDPLDRKVAIGCAKPRDSANCFGRFFGEIDEFMMGEVGTITNPSTSPFIPNSHTLALYHLDGNIDDVTNNHANGTISGNVDFVNSGIPVPTAPFYPSTSSPKKVFVTSTTYDGNLGGAAGADAKCQERANAARLGGTWRAWISDKNSGQIDGFTKTSGGYLLSGIKIAENWPDLTDGNLISSINIDEAGRLINSGAIYAWTNVKADSYINDEAFATSCNHWTSSASNVYGMTGTIFVTNQYWSSLQQGVQCSSQNRLYCFEQ